MDIKSSKTKLFLIELIVVIFLFAVSSVVCVNLFASARLMSINSSDMTNAMLRAQSAAEMIRRPDGDPRAAAVDNAVPGIGGYTVYYDENWAGLPGEAQSAYQMTVTFTEDERLLKADIAVKKRGDELYRINTAHYLGPGE